MALTVAWHERLGHGSHLRMIAGQAVVREMVWDDIKMDSTFVKWKVSLQTGAELQVFATKQERVPLLAKQEAGDE